MTYTSLVDQIISYLNRRDISTLDQIPNFISQAEQRIARESKNIGLEVYVTGFFTAGLAVLQKPSRWRRNLSLSYGTGIDFNNRTQIFLRSYEFLRNYWPDSEELSSPLYYSDYGYNNLLVAPTPDQNYPFEYCYLQLPEQLTLSNQTNWITQNAPDVLLYASLLEAIPFLKDDERIPVWQQYYQMGLKSLNDQDDQRVLDRSSNRAAD